MEVLSKKQASFFTYATLKMLHHGVDIIFKNSNKVDDTSGYFEVNKNKMIMAVATKLPQNIWYETFIHEFHHFEQYLDYKKGKCKAWERCILDEGEPLDYVLEHFKNKRNLTNRQINDYLYYQAAVEHDCESRSVKSIKNFGIDIDLPLYIQRANCYISFYFTLPFVKSWYNSPPYLSEKLLCLFSNKKIQTISTLKKIGEENKELFKKEVL